MSASGYAHYLAYIDGYQPALEELIRECSDSLVRYAYCYLRDAAAAEDVMEETVAALIFKKKKFADADHFRAFLYKVARNKSIDYLRRRGREVPLENVEEVLSSWSTEDKVLRDERNRKLYACMQELPAQYKEVLYLNFMDGFDISEICRIMKKNRKQVYNLIARAKADLKERLIKEGITHEDI